MPPTSVPVPTSHLCNRQHKTIMINIEHMSVCEYIYKTNLRPPHGAPPVAIPAWSNPRMGSDPWGADAHRHAVGQELGRQCCHRCQSTGSTDNNHCCRIQILLGSMTPLVLAFAFDIYAGVIILEFAPKSKIPKQVRMKCKGPKHAMHVQRRHMPPPPPPPPPPLPPPLPLLLTRHHEPSVANHHHADLQRQGEGVERGGAWL